MMDITEIFDAIIRPARAGHWKAVGEPLMKEGLSLGVAAALTAIHGEQASNRINSIFYPFEVCVEAALMAAKQHPPDGASA